MIDWPLLLLTIWRSFLHNVLDVECLGLYFDYLWTNNSWQQHILISINTSHVNWHQSLCRCQVNISSHKNLFTQSGWLDMFSQIRYQQLEQFNVPTESLCHTCSSVLSTSNANCRRWIPATSRRHCVLCKTLGNTICNSYPLTVIARPVLISPLVCHIQPSETRVTWFLVDGLHKKS